MRPVWLNVISSCIPNELLQMLLHKIHRSLFALCWQRVIMPELQASCPCAAVGSILAACLQLDLPAKKSESGRHLGPGIANGAEGICLQGRSTNKESIHVILVGQLCCILVVH